MTLYAASVSSSDITSWLGDFADNLLAVAALAVLLWKVALPHAKKFVQDAVAQLVGNQAAALEQLTVERSDTVAGRAKAAAEATTELPRLREQLGNVIERLRPLEEANLVYRVGVLEVEGENHGRRLGRLENVVIDELSGALRAERQERLHDQSKRLSDDQLRADGIRDRRRDVRAAEERARAAGAGGRDFPEG